MLYTGVHGDEEQLLKTESICKDTTGHKVFYAYIIVLA